MAGNIYNNDVLDEAAQPIGRNIARKRYSKQTPSQIKV